MEIATDLCNFLLIEIHMGSTNSYWFYVNLMESN